MTVGRFLGGIGALVWYPPRQEYLLLRRAVAKDFGPGIWECVTGRVDQGEGFLDALRREVREEIGVVAAPSYFVGATHFYRGSAVPENELIGVVFACTITDPAAVRLSPEHDALRWLTAAQAHDFLTATDPATRWIRQVIDRAEAIRAHSSHQLLAYFHQTGFELG